MRNRKITPFLMAYPFAIILYITYVYLGTWTPFSLMFIIGFIVVSSFFLLLDRFFIKAETDLRRVWIVESIFLLLFTIYAGCRILA